jgi:porphobilinogen synthase
MKLEERPRRLRKSAFIREMVQETHLHARDFVWPVFIKEGRDVTEPIKSLPGRARVSIDVLLKNISSLEGLKSIALFPSVEDKLKTSTAAESYNADGLVPRAIKAIKDKFPDLVVVTDVALDPYSSDGHDGLVKDGKILNDETVEILVKQALSQAAAGADFVAPSDMMDGRVAAIREGLDRGGHSETGIISYTAKYASCFYGPFRDALESAPRFGDKKTYQMNPMNKREAEREARLDKNEGADIMMVKPALAYLDVIQALKKSSDLPIAAYNVSGEYAMVKAAAANGWLDEKKAVLEILGSMKRAGADLIFTYHAPDAMKWITQP